MGALGPPRDERRGRHDHADHDPRDLQRLREVEEEADDAGGPARERRLQRLRSQTPDDNRITFGCINVPAPFYADVIRPLFRGVGGIVYILPEITPVEEVFPNFQFRSSSRAMSSR